MIGARKLSVPYAQFKVAMLALLTADTVYYLVAGTWSKGMDSAAWLALLVLFELETGRRGFTPGTTASFVIRLTRLAAAAAVCAAAIGYVYEADSLDAINAGVWIAVVVLLEGEVRFAKSVARHRMAFAGVATALYAGLAVLVLAWAWRGEWLDAYDALLWLIAFVMIEMDVLQLAPGLEPGAKTLQQRSTTDKHR
jgi:hypothetical protein